MTDGKPVTLAKICGVRTPQDAAVVAAAGADFMGTVLSPGYLRSVTPEQARQLYELGPAQRVGVFVNESAEHIVELATVLALDVIQLHGQESPATVARVAGEGPWQIWKTFHAKPDRKIRGDKTQAGKRQSGSLARTIAPYKGKVSGVLIDAWSPTMPGGTGLRFSSEAVDEEVRASIGDADFIAAGGMTPATAATAIDALAPDVLDVSSGVETTPGVKDAEKVRAFVRAMRR